MTSIDRHRSRRHRRPKPSAAPAARTAYAAVRLYASAPWGIFDIMPDGKSILFVDRVREGDPQTLVVNLHALARP